MPFWEAYLSCASGVILSVAIPILSKSVQQHFGAGGPAEVGGAMRLMGLIWRQTRRYRILAAFSLAVAALLVAFLGDSLVTWKGALIAGYLWDSTLQKIAGRP
jgi:hypothetical protein